MNLAYYMVVFDRATDALWAVLGLGEAYRTATGGGTFAAEAHILYRAELLLGETVDVTVQILGADSKRIHLAYEMRRADTVASHLELMLLHVDLGTRKVAPFRGDAARNVAAAAKAHATLPFPDWAGRPMRRTQPPA